MMRLLALTITAILTCSTAMAQSVSANRYTTDLADLDAHASASLAYSDNATTPADITVTTAGTWYKVPLDDSSFEVTSHCTFDDANDRIIVLHPGKYVIAAQFSFSGTANTTFTGRMFKNDQQCFCGFKRKMGATGDVGSASLVSGVSMAAGDYLELKVTADGSSKTFSVHLVQMTVFHVAN